MFMKLTVTPLERPSRAMTQGLYYHICLHVNVLSQLVPTCAVLFGQTNKKFGETFILCPTIIFHTASVTVECIPCHLPTAT